MARSEVIDRGAWQGASPCASDLIVFSPMAQSESAAGVCGVCQRGGSSGRDCAPPCKALSEDIDRGAWQGAENIFLKEGVIPRSDPASQHIFTRVYFVHIYEYIFAEIESIWIFQDLQVSRPDPWAHIRVPHVQCVCVCVCTYTHIHPYTLPPRSKNREDEDNTYIFPDVNNKVPH